MRKIILGVAVSLDSFIEGPNGEYDWCFTDQDYGLGEFFKRIDAIFMGRKSYDVAQKYGSDNPWTGIKTYVFSRSTKDFKDATLVTGNIVSRIREIKNEPGKDIWLFGGAELTTLLMNERLVDEVWLSIHPILLGSGKPLFQNISNRIGMKLIHSQVYETGLVSARYSMGS